MAERPTRDREGFRLTPFLLATIIAALVSTGLVILAWLLDVNASVPATGSALPGRRTSLIVAVGFGVVAWTSVIVAACYDQVIRHIDHVADVVRDAAADLVVQAEEAGVFRGMNIEANRPNEPPPDEGGRVLPFRG